MMKIEVSEEYHKRQERREIMPRGAWVAQNLLVGECPDCGSKLEELPEDFSDLPFYRGKGHLVCRECYFTSFNGSDESGECDEI